jgi:hypothetical protein
MPSPYRREELIADTATLVYLLSDPKDPHKIRKANVVVF